MKRFVLHVGKIVLIAAVLMECLCFLLMKSFRDTLFYKTNHAFVVSNKHYDFVTLGSSRGLTSINTKAIMAATNRQGFNYSMDDTHIGSHYLMLQHLLDQNITFDTLFLIYENTAAHVSKVASSDYRFLPFSERLYVKKYFREKNAPVFYNMNALPFVSMGYFNVELLVPSVYTLFNNQIQYRYDDVGDYEYPTIGRIDKTLSPVNIKLNFDNDDLSKISNLCKSNNIQLIVLVTPSFRTICTFSGNTQAYSIIDLSREKIRMDGFYDRVHLNKIGKDSVTAALLRNLKN